MRHASTRPQHGAQLDAPQPVIQRKTDRIPHSLEAFSPGKKLHMHAPDAGGLRRPRPRRLHFDSGLRRPRLKCHVGPLVGAADRQRFHPEEST